MELRRMAGDRIFWALVVLSLALNGILVAMDKQEQPIYRALSSLCGPITEQSLSELEQIYQDTLTEASAKYQSFYGTETGDLQELYAKGCLGDEKVLEKMQLREQSIAYGKAVMNGKVTYDLTGFEASRNGQFPHQLWQAQHRAAAVLADGELAWVTVSRFTSAWKTLFSWLVPAVLLESLVIAALLILKSMESESVFGTASLVYTTRTGRKVLLVRTLAGYITVTVVYVFLAVTALGTFFLTYPQPETLTAPMAAQVSWLPKVSFTGMTYLLTVLAVGYGILTIFLLLSAAAGLWQTNAFLGTAVLAAVTGGMVLAQRLCSGSVTFGTLLLAGNPAGLLLKFQEGTVQFRTGSLFSYTPDCYSVPDFEPVVLALWAVLGTLALLAAWRSTSRKEVPV